MSYEQVDNENVIENLARQILENSGGGPETLPSSGNEIQLTSQGNKGDSFGQTTGLKSDTPIVANLTDLGEDGITTGTTDRINLGSSLTIVDYATPSVDIDLRYINFKPAAGTHVKFTPKVGRTLVLKTGGDFQISTEISIAPGEYVECLFLSQTETGISGGGFRPLKIGSSGGGGGEFFGPWTADHDAGGFDLVDMSQIFFGSGFTKAISETVAGVGIFADTLDDIEFLIGLVSKVIIDNNEISTSIDIDMNQNEVRDSSKFGFTTSRYFQNDTTLGGIDLVMGASDEFYIFRGVNTVAEYGAQINFFDQLNMDDNNIAELASLLFDEGHSIQGGVSEFAFLTNSGDVESHYNNVTKIMEINGSGVIMENSNTITLDDLLSSDTLQISQLGGDSVLNYTGDMQIKESGNTIFSLGGLQIDIERSVDMNNNVMDNLFTLEIEENFGIGGVPSRPTNGAKLFVREKTGDATKRELRVYFPSGTSQFLASEP